jgi:hypothetical protein
MLRPEVAETAPDLTVEVLGGRHAARVLPESPYDPANNRLRA